MRLHGVMETCSLDFPAVNSSQRGNYLLTVLIVGVGSDSVQYCDYEDTCPL